MSSNKEYYDKYVELLDQFIKYPDYEITLVLMRELTSDAKMNGFDEKMGPVYKQTYEQLQQLKKKINYDTIKKHRDFMTGKINEYDDSIDWKGELEELIQHRKIAKDNCEIENVQIMLIRKRIGEIRDEMALKLEEKEELVRQKVKEIEELAAQLHNMDLIKNHEVTTLYSGGEITSEKGGEIYRHRSVFTMKASICGLPKITLQESRGKFTYAILTDSNAHKIRKLMMDLARELR